MLTKSDKIKLLKFVSTFFIGGTERHVVNLARWLDRSRFEVHMACLRHEGHILEELEPFLTPVTEYRISSLYPHKAARAQLRCARVIRDSGIDIVHSYGLYANIFAIPAARLAGAGVVMASIRDTGDMYTPMQRLVQKLVCRLADCIVVNAEAIQRRLISEGYRPEKIVVLRNGIDLSRFVDKRRGSSLRQDLGLPAQSPLVTVLCRLIRLKGLEYFLDAVAMVAGRFPEVRFLIVGEDSFNPNGPYKKELEAYAVRLGLGQRVMFTGLRLDVPEVLLESSVSVLPSLSEGLSNVLLESMAAGVPVVATSVGGNPEVVVDGITGLLVPPGNPEVLARAICRLLEDPALASRFGQAGRQRVIERFLLERMVQETESLYLDLLNRAGLPCPHNPIQVSC